MAKPTLDPHSLAERLDTSLPPGRFDTPAGLDDPLIDLAVRLAAAPQPEPLGSAARARIRSQVVASYRQTIPHPSRFPRITPGNWWLIVLVGVLVVVGLIVTRRPPDTATFSIEATQEPVATDTAEPATATPPEATPEVTPPTDSDMPTTIVIEGPVQAIRGNVITVFGTDVEVAPDNPLLTVLQVGDLIRVEGDITERDAAMVIVVVNIVLVDVDVAVGASGQVWRDDGGCLNPPPDWAVARGWRRRCSGQGDGGGGSPGGS